MGVGETGVFPLSFSSPQHRKVLFGLLPLDLKCVSTAGCVAPNPMSTLEVPSQQCRTFLHGINEEQSKEHMVFSKFLLPYYTKVIIFVDQTTGSWVSIYSPTLCGDVGRLWLHTDGPQLVINRYMTDPKVHLI